MPRSRVMPGVVVGAVLGISVAGVLSVSGGSDEVRARPEAAVAVETPKSILVEQTPEAAAPEAAAGTPKSKPKPKAKPKRKVRSKPKARSKRKARSRRRSPRRARRPARVAVRRVYTPPPSPPRQVYVAPRRPVYVAPRPRPTPPPPAPRPRPTPPPSPPPATFDDSG